MKTYRTSLYLLSCQKLDDKIYPILISTYIVSMVSMIGD